MTQVSQTNVKSSTNPSCSSSPCSCCLVTFPCTSGNTHCGGQCKDGYFGGKCLSHCPTNCIRCMDHPDVSPNVDTYLGKGYCTECKIGYYFTQEFYQCQSACPDGCQSCTSATDCTTCKDGYFKDGSTCARCAGCGSCTSSNATHPRLNVQNVSLVTVCEEPLVVSGPPWTAIVGGVVGVLVLIVVVIVVIVICRKRLCRKSNDSNREHDDIPTYINAVRDSETEAQETKKAVQDKTRQLQKYQQKAVEYTEKAVQIQHELIVIQEQQINREDGANSGTESQTYESLDKRETGDHPYADLVTK